MRRDPAATDARRAWGFSCPGCANDFGCEDCAARRNCDTHARWLLDYDKFKLWLQCRSCLHRWWASTSKCLVKVTR